MCFHRQQACQSQQSQIGIQARRRGLRTSRSRFKLQATTSTRPLPDSTGTAENTQTSVPRADLGRLKLAGFPRFWNQLFQGLLQAGSFHKLKEPLKELIPKPRQTDQLESAEVARVLRTAGSLSYCRQSGRGPVEVVAWSLKQLREVRSPRHLT